MIMTSREYESNLAIISGLYIVAIDRKVKSVWTGISAKKIILIVKL